MAGWGTKRRSDVFRSSLGEAILYALPADYLYGLGTRSTLNRKDGHIAAGVALMLIALSSGGDVGSEHDALWVVSSIVTFVGGAFLVFFGYRGTTKPPRET